MTGPEAASVQNSVSRMGRPAGRARRALVGVTDQLLYSFSNLVLTLLVAKYSSVTNFGAYAIVAGTFLIGSAMNRGLTAEPTMIRFSASPTAEWRDAAKDGLTLSAIFGVIFSLVILAPIAIAAPGNVANAAVVFAVATPFLFAQDFLRYAALANSRPGAALSNDAVVAVVQYASYAVAIIVFSPSGHLFIVLWAVAGGCGLVCGSGLLGIRPGYRNVLGLSKQWALALRLAVDNLVTQIGQQGAVYLVVLTAGLQAVAGLRGAQTILTPAAILLLGVQTAALPELVRTLMRSSTKMHTSVLRLAMVMFGVSVAYVLAATLTPTAVGTALFGQTWKEADPLIPIIGVGVVASTLANVANLGLRSLGDARRVLVSRASGLAVSLGALIPLSIIYQARGAAYAISLSAVLQAFIWWFEFERSMRDRRRLRGRERVAQRWRELVEGPASIDMIGL